MTSAIGKLGTGNSPVRDTEAKQFQSDFSTAITVIASRQSIRKPEFLKSAVNNLVTLLNNSSQHLTTENLSSISHIFHLIPADAQRQIATSRYFQEELKAFPDTDARKPMLVNVVDCLKTQSDTAFKALMHTIKQLPNNGESSLSIIPPSIMRGIVAKDLKNNLIANIINHALNDNRDYQTRLQEHVANSEEVAAHSSAESRRIANESLPCEARSVGRSILRARDLIQQDSINRINNKLGNFTLLPVSRHTAA